ncbi:E3 ubiquitin-protein ligase RNF135 [Suricata suricatta]|uniref:E3 ubiquitin-protein ligase RNF135 n=1 Tax=Suricata suricatta TaxID=37032 RepID=UPI0011558AC7|nr:E3 ubiquitin-protein ligase RNF135 [Suricata suricatta]
MTGLDPGLAIPVWLAEDDLGCIICQGLLAWPATLPCGHSFCRDCLKGLWAAGSPRSCPTCREGAALPQQLRKNTLLQELTDKYSQALREEAGPRGPSAPRLLLPPRPAALALRLAALGRVPASVRKQGNPASWQPSHAPALSLPARCHHLFPVLSAVCLFEHFYILAAAQKSIAEVGRELEELVERLVDIVRSLQSQTHLPESGPDNEGSTPSLSFAGGVDLSLASSKPMAPHTPKRKMSDILHDLEEIREKLQANLTWKAALEEPLQVEPQEAPSSSSCLRPDHDHLTPARASRFAQWAISPTFDLRSHSCSLEVSQDLRVVTVSRCPQTHLWSHERFVTCQVLCSQAFSSGQQYWEVDTQHCSHWAVGVASWGMRRNQTLGRTGDSWCLEWKGTRQLSAWHMVKETILGSDRPKVVGIWLDLEEGTLAFYSVATEESLLYECPVSSSSPLHPAFWLYGLTPGNSLTIRPAQA